MPNTQLSRDYGVIPAGTISDLVDYVHNGRAHGSGHFLNAVLCNDLGKAFEHGDESNITALRAIVMWLYNRAPQGCYGSPEVVKKWRNGGGLRGLMPHLTQEELLKYRDQQLLDTVLSK